MATGNHVNSALRLTIAYQTVLTVWPIGILKITMVHIVNTSGADATVNVCYVPSGGVAGVANAALFEFTVPANDFIEFGEGEVLPASTTIQALASANDSINIRISGYQE